VDLALRRTAALVAAATLALGLSACGSDDGHSSGHGSMTGSASPSAAADHDQADVMFATMMVPHHLQAIEMADLVPDRTRSAQVRDLAERIRRAQQPEVAQMSAWLAGWGASPMEDHDAMAGHGMNGMMGADDLRDLATLKGAAFDERWLEMMVEHHEGAVTSAKAVLREGVHPGTRALAVSIISSQQKEIVEMKALLAG
jgi:uncharacterized protein (DUF305 family)